MSEIIDIKSKLKNYKVKFVADSFESMAHEISNNTFLIIDSNIFDLYKNEFNRVVAARANILVIEAAEKNKSYLNCGEIINKLIAKNIRRNHKLLAVGGGIIQDITAFTASILFRGLNWSFIPTTLLAQGDSCVGGKTSINFGEYKNTLGNFYPPDEIIIDTSFLDKLPIDDIKSGIGEMLHFYFYDNSPFLEKIFDNYSILLKDRSLLKDYIIESLRIKKSVIEIDEFDKGERNKFNYGHTFGHALESQSNFKIKHGQAVTIGMDLANYISCKYDYLSEELYNEYNKILSKNFPDYSFTNFSINTYIKYLLKDKKVIDDQLVCILSKGAGNLFKVNLDIDKTFVNHLKNYFLTLV